MVTSCKYERILAHVRQQLKRYPTYQIQVCGHSMGGAMATLTAFCLAAEPDGLLGAVTGGGTPVLITCVSIASPRIGNGNFVRAVAELEIQKKLRHLRIVNSDDIVTALPDTTMIAFGLAAHWIRQNFFLHAGMCLHMSKEDEEEDSKNDSKNNTADFFFPKLHPDNHALYDWTHRTKNMAKRVLTLYHLASTNVPQTHHPLEYQARLKRRSVVRLLQLHSWDDLYEKYFGHLQR
jgi:pimeloyl-ACP methyl ester carboxylesterase